MRFALLALAATLVLAVALVTEAIFDSRVAGGIAFAAMFVALVSGRLAPHD
ncbi:MAG TPA: hypothetical protein VGJ32_02725 [Solirubrobacteraceae bacterium]|jgi:hypothetical protein